MHIPEVHLKDFQYILPEEKIAKYPLDERQESKLLCYQGGEITHSRFRDIGKNLSKDSSLWFNDTKVIPARLFFTKATGAVIEVFLLQPEAPTTITAQAMQACGTCTWTCMIGNLKRWKAGTVLESSLQINGRDLKLKALLEDRDGHQVTFLWGDPHLPFATIIQAAGELPLPPYFNRKPEKEDNERYQTVYAQAEGAVAAPTAGLHFTDDILHHIQKLGVDINYLTLHVSAGTFQPVKEEVVSRHPMHSEQMVISIDKLKKLSNPEKSITAVGTTSMRTLESLYWYGVQLLFSGDTTFFIKKLQPYQYDEASLPSREGAFKAILEHMKTSGITEIHGSTEIFIFPGYQFRVCEGLITNFHLPKSTLLMLISAFIGPDWKKVYAAALNNGYRFLSYGDSSLLVPRPKG